ncbi:MAG: chromate transporter, partial [Pyrinomonadaceae bacterium]|nr:chromate transporter [Pyrinomonadaceae bacterium]
RALKRRAHFLIAVGAFVAIFFLHIPFPVIVLAAGLCGLAGARLWPRIFNPTQATATKPASPSTGDDDSQVETTRNESSNNTPSAPSYVIEDDAPQPAHTLPSKRRTLKILLTGFLLWAVPFILIIAWGGWASLHAHEYRFFTQAALVTFGGAYAVLAYVTQAAVGSYHWLTGAQAVDGLALAETTPGPLIMVLQFVGFMAGWNNPPGGMSQTASAIAGALITTYTTFLPCFLFIFLGAPHIERLRGNKNLTGALSGITAAIVGVILNLALVFGAAVIWPQGFAGATDWFAAGLSVVAFVALYRLKLDVLWVVLAGGALGFLHAWLIAR